MLFRICPFLAIIFFVVGLCWVCSLSPITLGTVDFTNGLLADVLFFRQATFSENTKRSYRTHQKTYHKFCGILRVPVVPASTSTLCLYAAYLARFLLPQSVCNYLNYVGLLHREFGLHNPLSDNWVVTSVMRGIKRTLGVPPKPRLPITIPLLYRIRSRLNLACSKHASFWAICLVSFFGLFRKAHLLPDSMQVFDPKRMFTRADFKLTGSCLYITVRWSKTIQMGQRTVTIPLVAIPASPVCPVSAVCQAFSLTPECSQSFQALCWHDAYAHRNCIFTYKSFMSTMSGILSEFGVTSTLYGTHSFRRGGATFALEAGVPLDIISLLGDWKSDAMFLYLHMPLSQRLAAQQTMTAHLTSLFPPPTPSVFP